MFLLISFASVSQLLWCLSLFGFLSSPHRSPAAPLTPISTQRVRPFALLDSWRKGGTAAKRPKTPQRLGKHRACAKDRALSIPAALRQEPFQGLREKTKPLHGEQRFLLKQRNEEPLGSKETAIPPKDKEIPLPVLMGKETAPKLGQVKTFPQDRVLGRPPCGLVTSNY